jgi:hypothetical protein
MKASPLMLSLHVATQIYLPDSALEAEVGVHLLLLPQAIEQLHVESADTCQLPPVPQPDPVTKSFHPPSCVTGIRKGRAR